MLVTRDLPIVGLLVGVVERNALFGGPAQENLRVAMDEYARLLNTHPDFEGFRERRAALRAADAELDPEKMEWLSGLHLRAEPAERRADRVAEATDVREELGLSRADLIRGAELLAERVQLVTELAEEMERIFQPPERDAPEAREVLERAGAAAVVRETRRAWEGLAAWSEEELDAAHRGVGDLTGASGRALYQPVRVALTGEAHGPALSTVARVLGRERTLERLGEVAGDEQVNQRHEAGEGDGERDR